MKLLGPRRGPNQQAASKVVGPKTYERSPERHNEEERSDDWSYQVSAFYHSNHAVRSINIIHIRVILSGRFNNHKCSQQSRIKNQQVGTHNIGFPTAFLEDEKQCPCGP